MSGINRVGMDLSPRQLEILTLLAEGATLPMIAKRLMMSVSTVKTHTVDLYKRLDVHNSQGAVGVAYRTGLLRAGVVQQERWWLIGIDGERITHAPSKEDAEREWTLNDQRVARIEQETRWVTPWKRTEDK